MMDAMAKRIPKTPKVIIWMESAFEELDGVGRTGIFGVE
jgi:hypothetical protein